ncbi:MAG TPA: hypothetical protein VH142_05150 [Polyangiaceae bacterium]|jgi:S-DNA-T family DNA segregation ATPase FtsK/SpoIIIE|nr:hypothetical protein [Polyangiaceae bacterium]
MSPQDRSFPRLPDDAEALLYEWPAPDRSALAWEGFSSDTMGRIDRAPSSAPSSTPAGALFDAPLPAEPGEGSLEPEPVEDAPNLAEAARAVLAASESMSPKELARQGLMAAARRRPAGEATKSPETAAGPRPEAPVRPRDEPRPAPPSRTGAVPPRSPHEARERRHLGDETSLREATARSEMPPATPGRPIGAAALGAAVALAASAALYFATRHDVAPSTVAFPTSEPVHAAAVTQPSSASVSAAVAAPMASEAAPATAAPSSNAEAVPATSAAPSRTTPVPTPALAARTDPPSKSKKASASASKVVLPETAEGTTDDSNAADPPAAKPPSAPPKAPSDEPTPNRPSVGLVQAAVGSVMMGARSCLAGQDSGSTATVTFGSDGRVHSVAISGPAAATPAEGCLKSALMAARVPPFSDPSYAFSLTVRPP